MPPLDLDTHVSCDGGGGGAELKAASASDTAATALSDDSDAEERDDDPYAPAQSLRLRIGEDVDWSEVVVGAVAVLERDDSTKDAGANPKCAARRSAAAAGAAARSSMTPVTAPRAAVAVVIGGLPGKAAREHGGRGRSPRRLRGRARRVFAAGEATADPLAEPGSPEVSCLGAVRSQPRAAAEGFSSGRRRWWARLVVADVASCCWNGRRERRRPRGSEAD